MQRTTQLDVLPYLFYENPRDALQWLSEVFGLSERFRLEAPNGAIAHAELEIGDGVVMIGNVGLRNRVRPSTVRSSVYVFVDDVDAHCQRATRAGAEIVEPTVDQPFGDRVYLAKDLEGHEWYFAQHMRDVSIEDLAARLFGSRSQK
jgi:uncharacterized glyoxalase superfamily protein PhnB